MGVMRQVTAEEEEAVIERLYGDAQTKRERLQDKLRQQLEREDMEMGPRNPQEYDDPQAAIEEMVERLNATARATAEKLEQKRAKQEEDEVEYLIVNSVHANAQEDPDEEVYNRLHEDHVRRKETLQKRVKDANDN